MWAVDGGRPSDFQTVWRIATSSRSSESMVSRSRARGAYVRPTSAALHHLRFRIGTPLIVQGRGLGF